jgi:probable lipoprotein NlpC
MPITLLMRIIFTFALFLCVSGLFAAPLERGYALAPSANASPAEKARAYTNARIRVVEAARKYLGTPYRYGGMSATGLDCSGLLVLSFREALGVTLPRSADALYTWTITIPPEKLQPGDFVFFRTDGTRRITHVGLYVGNRIFIHAASAGSQTGVIYSSLDERYYRNTYAGAGRAFPEVPHFTIDNVTVPSDINTSSQNNTESSNDNRQGNIAASNTLQNNSKGRIMVGAALAPIWNMNIDGGSMFRGITSQFCLEADTGFFGPRLSFGLELRPEYDNLFNMFRLPITLSLGISDIIKVFFGPVIGIGDASNTILLGIVGVTFTPMTMKNANGEFSPYVEAAWQSIINNDARNINSSFYNGFRFTTGIRWMMQVL